MRETELRLSEAARDAEPLGTLAGVVAMMKSSRSTADPTPEEIAATCEAIRSRWSEAERRKRAAWCVCEGWTAPTVEVDDDELVTGT